MEFSDPVPPPSSPGVAQTLCGDFAPLASFGRKTGEFAKRAPAVERLPDVSLDKLRKAEKLAPVPTCPAEDLIPRSVFLNQKIHRTWRLQESLKSGSQCAW